ncbi:MAG: NTP transferase domain-containing protein [bacterium]|nr:NTP transferase domain-containing protein [Candidatus Kapabacteria bacterium]
MSTNAIASFQRPTNNSPARHTRVSSNLAVVIMAAGKGTRMKSPDMAKVMFPVGGVPMIHHVVERAFECAPQTVVVIIGHNRESVRGYLDGAFNGRVTFAEQIEQLGTGHAIMQALPSLEGFDGDVVVLSGDVPLLRRQTLEELHRVHQSTNAVATVLTVSADDPTGYGRVVRLADESVDRIVEHKDATDAERTIDEINSGIYMFGAKALVDALAHLTNDNVQGEYYLTDVFGWLRSRGERIAAFRSPDFGEIQGINTVEQLADVNVEFARRAATTVADEPQ